MTKITEKTSFKFSSPLSREYSITPELESISDDTESEITFEVKADGKGWFEFTNEEFDEYMSGGLWFEGDELTDYDGCFELPEQLVSKLRELGYNMDYVN